MLSASLADIIVIRRSNWPSVEYENLAINLSLLEILHPLGMLRLHLSCHQHRPFNSGNAATRLGSFKIKPERNEQTRYSNPVDYRSSYSQAKTKQQPSRSAKEVTKNE